MFRPLRSIRNSVAIGLAFACADPRPAIAASQMRYCDPFLAEAPFDPVTFAVRDTLVPLWSSAPRPAIGFATSDGPGSSPYAWQQLLPPNFASNAANLVLDPVEDRFVLFGQYGYPRYGNKVWTRPRSDDSAPWTELTVDGSRPEGILASTTIYDPVRRRIVVCGGYPSDGVWALSLSGTPSWTHLALDTGPGPGPLPSSSAIYDPDGDRLIVLTGDPPRNEVWAFALGDGSGWTLLHPPGPLPEPRTNYAAVYDPNRHRMILFSGKNFSGGFDPPRPDVWALSLLGPIEWTEIHPAGELPPQRMQAAFAFDAVHDRLVITEGVVDGVGAVNDTWVLQFGGTPSWSRISTPTQPIARNSPCMLYDARDDRYLMVGGGVCDTWSLKLSPSPTWALLQPEEPGPPFPGYMSSALYDASRHRALRAGGITHFFIHGTTYRGGASGVWALRTDRYARWSAPAPIADDSTLLEGTTLILDPVGDRLLRVGGLTIAFYPWQESGLLGPSQLPLDGSGGWNRLATQGASPPGRYAQAAAFDPVRRRVVMFGGRAGEHALGDTWILDLNGDAHWSLLESPFGSPEPRFGASAVYDPIGDRILLFGGISGDDLGATFGDTWQLSLGSDPLWTRLLLPSAPPSRCFAATVYDERRQRLVAFGGRDAIGTPLRDLWFLPLGSGAGWVLGDTSGSAPRGRWGAGAAYDPDADRMLVFDGATDPCDFGGTVFETLALNFYTPPLDPLTLGRIESHPGNVTIEWRAPAGTPFLGLVERRTEKSAWSTAGSVALSSDGTITFHDDAATPGVRYAYRVRWSSGASAGTSDPVWTNVPPLRLALVRPANPSAAGVRVSFSLPNGEPARLELLDIGGRRIVSRDVGEMGPGDHVLELAPAGRLTPGMYVVRLTRGTESRSERISVIR